MYASRRKQVTMHEAMRARIEAELHAKCPHMPPTPGPDIAEQIVRGKSMSPFLPFTNAATLMQRLQNMQDYAKLSAIYLDNFSCMLESAPQLRWVSKTLLHNKVSIEYHAYHRLMEHLQLDAKYQSDNLQPLQQEQCDHLQKAWTASLVSPVPDDLKHQFAYYLTSCWDASATGLHAEVAYNLLQMHARDAYTLNDWTRDMRNWTQKDLLHVFLICVRKMPQVDQWLHRTTAVSDTKQLQAVLDKLNSLLRAGACARDVLVQVEKATQLSDHVVQTHVASSLECAAHVLGLHGVDTEPLKAMMQAPLDILTKLADYMQTSCPRSLLCPVLVVQGSPALPRPPGWTSWGFERIGLSLDFHTHVLTLDPSMRLQALTSSSPAWNSSGGGATSSLIPMHGTDVLFKLGAEMLSPEVALLVQHPVDIARYLRIGVDTISGREHTMVGSGEKAGAGNRPPNDRCLSVLLQGCNDRKAQIQDCLSMLYHHFEQYVRSVECKLDSPAAAPLVFVGWSVRPPACELHFAPEVLTAVHPKEYDAFLAANHSSREPHSIARLQDAVQEGGVAPLKRRCMECGIYVCVDKQAGGATRLDPNMFGSTVRSVIRKHMTYGNGLRQCSRDNATSSLLHETVACLTLHEPDLHMVVPLGQPMQWKQEYQDSRYSETQVGSMGNALVKDRCHFFTEISHSHDVADLKGCINAHVVVQQDRMHRMSVQLPQDRTSVHVVASQPLHVKNVQALLQGCRARSFCDDVYRSMQDVRFAHVETKLLAAAPSADGAIADPISCVYMDRPRRLLMLMFHVPDSSDPNVEFVLCHLEQPQQHNKEARL